MSSKGGGEDPNDLPGYMTFTIKVDFQRMRDKIENGFLADKWKEILSEIVKQSIDVQGHEMTNKVVVPAPVPPNPDEVMNWKVKRMLESWYCSSCLNTFYCIGDPMACPTCGNSKNLKEEGKSIEDE